MRRAAVPLGALILLAGCGSPAAELRRFGRELRRVYLVNHRYVVRVLAVRAPGAPG
jgi:hypothetical protein